MNAFNPMTQWYDTDVIGIDTGITMLMAENLRTRIRLEYFYEEPRGTTGSGASRF